MTDNSKQPLSNTEKSQALRKRRAKAGQKELRGIWITNDEEAYLKPMIKQALEDLRNSGTNQAS